MEYKARRAWEDQTMRLVCHTEEGRLYTKGLSETWYIYPVEYHSAIEKNTFESVLMRWMKLGPIIQSEVSQKEKHQYSILMHIYGF